MNGYPGSGLHNEYLIRKTEMIDRRNMSSQIRFRGAIHIEPLADKQQGPTCGFEAIENIIQLFHNVPNNLTETDLIRRAASYQGARPAPGGYSLDVRVYRRLLQDYGIPSQWYPFDHLQVILPALLQNRAVLVVGDAYYLNPQAYALGSPHAFVLTNYYTDESEYYVLGYLGIDSNFEKQEMAWLYQNVEIAAQTQKVSSLPVLITDIPINWPSKAKYCKMLSTGHMIPVY